MNSPDASRLVSAIVPVGNRISDLEALYEDYSAGLRATGHPYELIFVIDGPNPDAEQGLNRIIAKGGELRVVNLGRVFGEATALMAGFEESRGGIILTLPAYFQIEASEIPKLVSGLQSADLCVARRWPRAGGWLESLRRRAFHAMVRKVSGMPLSDLGCGARAMHRRVLEEISLYGDQHRFIPVLASRQGFRTAEIDLQQSPKDCFDGSYRAREYAHRLLDIFTVFFLVRFTKKPLRFFGMIGATTFAAGVLITLWLVIERLFMDVSLADRPALLLSSLLIVLGVQIFAIGLLGELMIFTHAREMKDYKIERVIEAMPERSAMDRESMEQNT